MGEHCFHGLTQLSVSARLSGLEAKGKARAGEPQINFLFIVAEWRLEMHGLL